MTVEHLSPADVRKETKRIEKAEADATRQLLDAAHGMNGLASGENFFGGEPRGLRAGSLAQAVRDFGPVGVDVGDRLWLYTEGAWRPDHANKVRELTVGLLGQRYTPGHLATVSSALCGSPLTARIDLAPHPEKMNVRNGLLDWSTATITDHDPAFMGTIQLPVDWAPDAQCPAVDRFLTEVLPADLLTPGPEGGPGFIWEMLGYMLMSGNPLHKTVLLLDGTGGRGRNGKGTMTRLLTAVMGHDNVSNVSLRAMEENRFALAGTVGKLANIGGEVDGKHMGSSEKLKEVTGGDTIQVEHKFEKSFSVAPFFVPVFSTNQLWANSDTSAAYLNRWVVIPFPNYFGDDPDLDLDRKLSQPSELAGVLRKAVEALPYLMNRKRFTQPPSIRAAADDFAKESDPIRSFVAEMLTVDTGGAMTAAEMFAVYQQWATTQGVLKPLTAAVLGKRLGAAGLTRSRTGSVRGWSGVRPRLDTDPEPGTDLDLDLNLDTASVPPKPKRDPTSTPTPTPTPTAAGNGKGPCVGCGSTFTRYGDRATNSMCADCIADSNELITAEVDHREYLDYDADTGEWHTPGVDPDTE